VAQVYVVNENASIQTSLKTLKGFQRISLRPTESKVVSFVLQPDDLSYVDADGQRKPLVGKVQICVGGSQPDEPNTTSGSVVKKIIEIK
jgi:beta-glucosidase